MPKAPPPARGAAPNKFVLAAGTRLWRVHKKYRSGADFNSVTADLLFGGHRFDSTSDDAFRYLYAAPRPQTALLETLARGIPFNDTGWRLLRRAAIRDYRISAIQSLRDLTLVSLLTTADLAAACQDEWLIHSPPSDYPQTRAWGRWLRRQAPWAAGLIWSSDRDLGGQSLVLFDDRCPAGSLRAIAGTEVDLDDAEGARWLCDRLAPFRIAIRPPSANTRISLVNQ